MTFTQEASLFRIRQTAVTRVLEIGVLLTLSTFTALLAGQGTDLGNAKQSRVIGAVNPVAHAGADINPSSSTPAAGAPCVVTLFNNFEFNTYGPQTFTYTPPASCPGPWSKVLFTGSFNVTEGIQFDRTASIQIGYVNIYFGTTEEPSPTSAPAWNVLRDLTDYSSLFETAQSGEVDLFNIVNSTYTGIIYGTATLSFYPVATGSQAPVVADAVYPLPDGPGGPYILSSPTSTLSGTFTLPTNIESAYLDVVAQGQQGDEFWYTCVPTDLSTELESCGGTAFRETEITIDGEPAGVAPVFPWIFTGGIDPYLWIPIPGVQTLNFVPYRVNLTPFAGLLSNGQPHTVSLSVFNDNNYFQAVASLLVYEDHGSTQVTGGILTNTIAPPSPIIDNNITTDSSGDISGMVVTQSSRPTILEGYVNTSKGQVITLVTNSIQFKNTQVFSINASGFPYTQDISQDTVISSVTATSQPSGSTTVTTDYEFPLVVNISLITNSTGYLQTTSISQTYQASTDNGISSTLNRVKTTDMLQFDSNFDLLSNSGQASSSVTENTVNGVCTGTTVTAANNAFTGKTSGCQ